MTEFDGQAGDPESRFEALFRNVPEPVVETVVEDADPVIRAINPAFESVFGYDYERAVGESIDELIVPDDRRPGATALNERVVEGERLETEVRREAVDGPREFLLRSAPLPTDDDEVRVYAIYIDITERKEQERIVARLHESTRELMAAETPADVGRIATETAGDVLDFSYSSVHLYDESEEVLYPVANTDAAREAFGPAPTFAPPQGIAGRAFAESEVIVLEDAQQDDRKLDDGPGDIRGYCVVPLGGRGIFTIASPVVGAVSDRDVEVVKVLAANMEAALRRADRERRLRESEREAARQNERLERVVSVVSHDLRNPIEVATAHLELARRECDSDHLDGLDGALDRMSALVEESLTLARQGETVEDPAPVELAAVATRAWKTVDTAGASLSVDLPESHRVLADPSRLRRLFENLFRNAIEHGTPDDRPTDDESAEPEVGIRVALLEDDAGFLVEDDGPGVPPEDRDRVFDPGYSTADEGTGLGLSIVWEIAGAHGWSTEVGESDEGGFRVGFEDVETA